MYSDDLITLPAQKAAQYYLRTKSITIAPGSCD